MFLDYNSSFVFQFRISSQFSLSCLLDVQRGVVFRIQLVCARLEVTATMTATSIKTSLQDFIPSIFLHFLAKYGPGPHIMNGSYRPDYLPAFRNNHFSPV